jgi:hypothetical protein
LLLTVLSSDHDLLARQSSDIDARHTMWMSRLYSASWSERKRWMSYIV